MRIASYNIMSGGFDSYASTATRPERLDKLKEAIKEINADFIALDDTFRWVDMFSDKDLCQLFNYKTAYHINMDDVRVDKRVGVTVMTNLPNPKFATLRLGTRSCIKTTITSNSKPLDIYSIYLDDLKESTRLDQISYLLKDISGDRDSIIMGDLNTTCPEGVNKSKKMLNDLLITNLLLIFKKGLDYLSYFRPVFRDMFKAEVITRLRQQGFVDARLNLFSPSAPTPLYQGVKNPIVEIDHILASPGIVTSNFQVLKGGIFDQASDHYPVVAELK